MFYISCNYSCTLKFFVKILLFKLKNLTSACFKLHYCTAKQTRWWNLSKLVINTLVGLILVIFCTPYRSSHSEMFYKKGVLRNFAKSTGKHLCQNLCFNKVADLRPSGFSVFLKEFVGNCCF